MRKLLLSSLILAFLAPTLAVAQDADRLREIAVQTKESTNALLQEAAVRHKVEVIGDSVFATSDDSSAAIMPVAGTELLTRQDLATWKTIGVITVAGPPDADSPSGSFSVRVQANPGSTRGQFQIADEAGLVVEEGELTIEDAPSDAAATAAMEKNAKLISTTAEFHYPLCYYPYGFRIFPLYHWGCHWWYYKWHWGYLRFHYCWWPHGCCWWWRCCWF